MIKMAVCATYQLADVKGERNARKASLDQDQHQNGRHTSEVVGYVCELKKWSERCINQPKQIVSKTN